MKLNKIVILQPSYIPWIGYFEQIIYADIFVFYDDVQYTKNDWRNRNKIKAKDSSLWLTIPVKASLSMLIKDVKIENTQNWKRKHLLTLKQFYGKAKYFEEIYNLIFLCFEKNILNLSDLCIQIIIDISSYLNISTKFFKSSELSTSGNRNERLIKICQSFNAKTYYTGYAAKDYLDEKKFLSKGINVKYQTYIHPNYFQLSGDFIPYLSILDLLFNYGKNSLEIIKRNT